MKEYPTIDLSPRYGEQVYIFDKLDGSNIRAEWDKKKGFWKFGRRHGLLDDTNLIIKNAEGLIQSKYSDTLSAIFRDQRWQKIVAFFEFWGINSFAGNHSDTDVHNVTLFDVSIDKKGILEPREFVKIFKQVDHASFLGVQNFNHEVEDLVRKSEFPGITFEGVVCKGSYISPGRPLMFKAKTQKWLDKLKAYCKGDDKLFDRMQ